MKTIILGGYAQSAKLLKKYYMNDHFLQITNKSVVEILSPKFGHKNAILQLDKLVEESKDDLVIHSISASSWYLMSYFQQKKNHPKIRGLILESNPYHFRYESLAKVTRKSNMFLNTIPENYLISIYDKFVTSMGADHEWKRNYLSTIENLPMLNEHSKILIIGSEEDRIVPPKESIVLHQKLSKNHDAKLYLSSFGGHTLLLRDNYDEYQSTREDFYKSISDD